MSLKIFEKEINVDLCRYSVLMEQAYEGVFYAIVEDDIRGPYTIDPKDRTSICTDSSSYSRRIDRFGMTADTICFKINNTEGVYYMENIKILDYEETKTPKLSTLFKKHYRGKFSIIDPKIDGTFIITDKRRYWYNCPESIEVSLIMPNISFLQRMIMNTDVVCSYDIND